jgi:hypothetical protein
MDEEAIARRLLEAAEKKGGSIFAGDLPQEEIEPAPQQGWLVSVGIGHFEITEQGRSAARR